MADLIQRMRVQTAAAPSGLGGEIVGAAVLFALITGLFAAV